MTFLVRFQSAGKAALVHLAASAAVAALAAVVVFLFWYPHPYGLLSGGRNLFLLVVAVDVVCGPLLTLVLYDPRKPRAELFRDMALVVLIQLAALGYGLFTAFQARPLYLVHELDRFRVIAQPDFQGVDVSSTVDRLPAGLRPGWFSGPVLVGIREPADRNERHDVMVESVVGGRDYSQRPEFYIPYDIAYAARVMPRAKPLERFLSVYPAAADEAMEVINRNQVSIQDAFFLPVLHRQDWVAILTRDATILGFLPGDGFAVVDK